MLPALKTATTMGIHGIQCNVLRLMFVRNILANGEQNVKHESLWVSSMGSIFFKMDEAAANDGGKTPGQRRT